MDNNKSITEHFGKFLAILLSDKIKEVHPEFDAEVFIKTIDAGVVDKTYTKRIVFIAEQLHQHLPNNYEEAIKILLDILGDENPDETGMFTNYWWIMPIGKFIEIYGIQHFEISINAIEEVTKRNTGEYAIRPFINKYPNKCLKRIKIWAKSENFHLRRLATEGLRPKLPWAPKLDTFIENPEPVFEILEILKEDKIMFVKKSVGNHLTDWLKVNPEPTKRLIHEWRKSENEHTQWIIKRATRKIK